MVLKINTLSRIMRKLLCIFLISGICYAEDSIKIVDFDGGCAITSDGGLYCLGLESDGLTRILADKKIRDVSVGSIICAITADNKLFCLGNNGDGQAGTGSTDKYIDSPVQILKGENISSVQSGYTLHPNTCALTTDNKLYCWGSNRYGQVGNDSFENQYTPVQVLKDVQSFKLSGDNTCAITKDKKFYCWGKRGVVVFQSPYPFQMLEGEDVKSYDVGDTLCAVTTDHKLFCWGFNTNYQIGDGTEYSTGQPKRILEDEQVDFVQCYGYVTCAITTDGKLFCWGKNDHGQIGNGSREDQKTPIQILKNKKIQSVTSDNATTCALTTDNEVFCWGSNEQYKVGNGSSEDQLTPVQILQNENIRFIEMNRGSYAITNDNRIYVWGGYAASLNHKRLTPVHLLPNEKVVSIKQVAFGMFSYGDAALTESGKLYILDPEVESIDGVDYCVNDPKKTEPGDCGCGIPDVDTDKDGVADCKDECPRNPKYTIRPVEGCSADDNVIPDDYNPNVGTDKVATPKTQPLVPFVVTKNKRAIVYFEWFLAAQVGSTTKTNFKYKVSVTTINRKIGSRGNALKTLGSKRNNIKLALKDGITYRVRYRIFFKSGKKAKYSRWSKIKVIKKK